MEAPTLLGKAELLAWAAQVTGITPCEKYADLRDGLVFLALARELFPHAIDSAVIRLQRRGARDGAKNWSLLTSCLRHHGIPLHLCNRQAVERGHTRHCFNLLVLFYFLIRLSAGDRFAVDFAQPVDPQLARFLQSPESVIAVARSTGSEAMPATGSKAAAAGTHTAAGDGERGAAVVTRLSSPPSIAAAAAASSPPVRTSEREQFFSAQETATDTHRRTEAERFAPRRQYSSQVGSLQPGYASLLSSSHDALLQQQPPQAHANTIPTAAAGQPLSSLSPSLLTENRLLREELHYSRAVSQLLVTQQRGAAAAAEMRAAATLKDELARAQLRHLHNIRQLEVAMSAIPASNAALPFSTSVGQVQAIQSHAGGDALEGQWRALAHRAEVAEETAAELYEQMQRSATTYNTTLQQLQQAFRSIEAITAAALPATTDAAPATSQLPQAHRRAAAYEEAVAAAMMAQLDGVPGPLRDAFEAQVRALLVTLNTLRVSNERLRWEVEGGSSDSGGNGRNVLSRPPSHNTMLQDVASECDEARRVCETASPAVQRACRRLIDIVMALHEDVEDARASAETWQRRCRQLETEAAASDKSATRTRSSMTKNGSLYGGETNVAEAEQLCDGVAKVLAAASSTVGTAGVIHAHGQLTSLLDLVVRQQQSSAALEKALAEQCETVASLRKELRLRGEALHDTSAALADAELRCRTQKEREEVRSGTAQGLWLGQSCSPSRTIPSDPQRSAAAHVVAPSHSVAAHRNTAAADKTVGASGAPATPHSAKVSSPYPHGSLRSPSPSTSDEGSNGVRHGEASAPQQHLLASPTYQIAGTNGTPLSTPRATHWLTSAASLGKAETPLVRPVSAPFTPLASEAAPASRLLSAAELERRKQEILRRYSAA